MGKLVTDTLLSYDPDLLRESNFMLPMIKILKHQFLFILIMRFRLIPIVGIITLLIIIGII
jgi:hypothetical protein